MRMTADERRRYALRAAVVEFGQHGYQGASTAAIAGRIGVSQAYLYHLFPSKQVLFAATAEACLAGLRQALERAVEGCSGPAALRAMADVYEAPTESVQYLISFQLTLCAAASGDSALWAVACGHFDALRSAVGELSRAGEQAVQGFFGGIAPLILGVPFGDQVQPVRTVGVLTTP